MTGSNLEAEIFNETHLGRMYRSKQRLRDRYALYKLLGRGGFGVTFLARDTQLPGSPVCVIKQLCPKNQDDVTLSKARQRFEQEAKTLAQLGSHSQIPQLLDYFEIEGEFYLVQEYIHGRTLSQEIRRTGAWSEEEVKKFLQEFLPLLRYVHRRHVIHRDIKPSNILRCRDDGRLVLIDFGAVKEKFAIAESKTIRSAISTHFVGTIGFSPPEQLAMRPVFASDIYALGMTCLYLLSAKPPIEYEYEPLTGEVKWYNLVRVSDHFGRILDKMLKLTPRDRFKSADDVLRVLELESYLETLKPCMSNHPLSAPVERSYQKPEFISPLMRTAIAIREWQARRDAKRRHEG